MLYQWTVREGIQDQPDAVRVGQNDDRSLREEGDRSVEGLLPQSGVNTAKLQVWRFTVDGASRPASRIAAKASFGISSCAKVRTLRR